MVEIFDNVKFESVLDKSGYKFDKLGLIYGEYCYMVKIDSKMSVYIRSSVHYTKNSAATGEDSIRVYLFDNRTKTLSGNVCKWVTRAHGWDLRLIEKIEAMITYYHKSIKICCGDKKIILISHTKQNPNRAFCKCAICGNGFEWLS